MDWNKEKNGLQKAGEQNEWFKPQAGQYKVRFLTNGEEYETVWEDKTMQKVRFDIEIKNKKYSWGVTKGKTEISLYGQIALCGAAMEGLVDKEITLLVKGSGKDVDYTVIEALPLMSPKEESV